MTLTRRQTLAWLGATAAGTAGLSFAKTVRPPRGPSLLRPPGALPPGAFEATCIRCFRCAEVCPPNAIRFDAAYEPNNADTPFLVVAERGCTLCMRCTEACPTGALERIAPDLVTIANTVRMGTPSLDRDRCLAWQRKQPCHLCVDVCPYPGVAIRLLEPRLTPEIVVEACVGCGLCAEACPDRAKAIDVRATATTRAPEAVQGARASASDAERQSAARSSPSRRT